MARRPLGPKGSLFFCVFFFAISGIMAAVTVSAHAAAVHSRYVQAHGTRDSATVVSVDNIKHTHKHSTTYTALVTVQLQQPVDGATNSVVHVPYQDNSLPGDTITVLVDPGQPGYSEVPGSPSGTTGGWVTPLIAAVITLVIAIFATVRCVRLFRQRWSVRGFAFPGNL